MTKLNMPAGIACVGPAEANGRGLPMRAPKSDCLDPEPSGVANHAEPPVIRVSDLVKSYQIGGKPLAILNGLSFSVDRGEFVSIMGPSGSGKSTLLNILGILDRYDSGEYWLNGSLIRNLTETESARCRGRSIGFVFQSFNLLPFISAAENVALPLYYGGVPPKQRNAKAREILDRMGLAHRSDHKPTELSGGQRQRVAIARALVTDPALILADEPTGNLDSQTSEDVMNLFHEINREEGKTLVLITHDETVAGQTHRILRMKDGNIETPERNEDDV